MASPKNVSANPLPIGFDQFRKNPIAAVAFCMLLAVSYLYFDLRSGYKDQIEKANQKIEALDVKIDKLTYALEKVGFVFGCNDDRNSYHANHEKTMKNALISFHRPIYDGIFVYKCHRKRNAYNR